jgi:hypothetical protein
VQFDQQDQPIAGIVASGEEWKPVVLTWSFLIQRDTRVRSSSPWQRKPGSYLPGSALLLSLEEIY